MIGMDDKEKALDVLHQAGLPAQSFKMEPGAIVGGRTREEASGVSVFGEAFIISPGFITRITGPGQHETVESHKTMQEAAEWVIQVYARRAEEKPVKKPTVQVGDTVRTLLGLVRKVVSIDPDGYAKLEGEVSARYVGHLEVLRFTDET